MKSRALKIFLGTILVTMLSLSSVSAYVIPNDYAPNNTPFKSTITNDPTAAASGTQVFLQILAGSLLYFAVPLGVLMLVFTGFSMVMSGSDPDKVGEAKKQIMWTLLGLVLIILSYTIVKVVIESTVTVGELSSGTETTTIPPAAE